MNKSTLLSRNKQKTLSFGILAERTDIATQRPETEMNIKEKIASYFKKEDSENYSWEKEIASDPNESHVKQTFLAVIVLLALVIFFSLDYYLNEFNSFYPQILAEAHGMVFDLFVVGVLVFWLDKSREKRWMISHYTEELEDLAVIKSKDSSLIASSLIKRLNRLGVTSFRINGLFLMKSNLRKCDLTSSSMLEVDLSGAKAERTNFTKALLNNSLFNGAMCNEAKFQNAYAMAADFRDSFCIQTCFRNAMLVSSLFDNAYLMKTDFEGAVLVDASFKGASLNKCNFKNTQGLTIEMIKDSRTWDGAIFDEEFERKLIDSLEPQQVVQE